MAKEHQVLIIAKNAPGIGTRILALYKLPSAANLLQRLCQRVQ